MDPGDHRELAHRISDFAGTISVSAKTSDTRLYRAFLSRSETAATCLAEWLAAARLIQDTEARWLKLDVEVSPQELRIGTCTVPVWIAYRTQNLLTETGS